MSSQVLWVGLFLPFIIPWVNALWFQLVFTARRPRIDRHDKVLNFDCLFRQVRSCSRAFEVLSTGILHPENEGLSSPYSTSPSGPFLWRIFRRLWLP